MMRKLFGTLAAACLALALLPATALAGEGESVYLLWQGSDGKIYYGEDPDVSSPTELSKPYGYYLLEGGYRLNDSMSIENELLFGGNAVVDLDGKTLGSSGGIALRQDSETGSLTLKGDGGMVSVEGKNSDYGNITGGRITIENVVVDGGSIGVCNGGSKFAPMSNSFFTMKSGSIVNCDLGILEFGTLTLDGGTVGTAKHPLTTAIVLRLGTMNANGGTVYGTVENGGTIMKEGNSATDFYGTVENGVYLGYFASGAYEGTIEAGVYHGAVNNNVVRNDYDSEYASIIKGGTFYGPVANKASASEGGASGKIEDGTFSGKVTNDGAIEGGTYSGEVANNASGTISGGTFGDKVINKGTITGGVFYGGIETEGSGTISGVQQYVVAFDLNGGTVSSGIAPASQVFVNVSDAKAQQPSVVLAKAGCFFTGKWYTDPACTQEYDFDSLVTSNITLYAGFSSGIFGIEDGKTYCQAQIVEVADYVDVESVTVNGVPVQLDEERRFTLNPAVGEQRVVVIDKADNSVSITVKVNDGHEGGVATCTKKAVCKYCGLEYGELNPNAPAEPEPLPGDGPKDAAKSVALLAGTGDDTHAATWAALLLASSAALAVAAAARPGRRGRAGVGRQ